MDRLANAFLPSLRGRIIFGAKLVALDYTDESVTTYCQTRDGMLSLKADFAILTNPYSTMRFVDVLKPFSFGKRMAIRQLHYSNAIKIFLHCRRLWEEGEGIYGGASLTDLPNRAIFCPEHRQESGQGYWWHHTPIAKRPAVEQHFQRRAAADRTQECRLFASSSRS